jgi:hypothetical protein
MRASTVLYEFYLFICDTRTTGRRTASTMHDIAEGSDRSCMTNYTVYHARSELKLNTSYMAAGLLHHARLDTSCMMTLLQDMRNPRLLLILQ